MSRIHKTRYAILGFLSMEPASGYDMKIKMEQSTDHFWKEGDGSIYPILKQLLGEGLVSVGVANAASNKPKKIYAITVAGKNVLQDWLEKDPEPAQHRNELLLKVFFGWNQAPEVTLRHLTDFRHKVSTKLQKCYSSPLISKVNSGDFTAAELHRFLVLKAGISCSEAHVKWCDDAIALLMRGVPKNENKLTAGKKCKK